MEAVFGNAAGLVPLEGTLAAGAALVGVGGVAVRIVSNEHHVVIRRRLIDHFLVREGVDHVPIKAAAVQQVGEDTTHVLVAFEKRERDGRQFRLRLRCGCSWNRVPTEQEIDCFRIVAAHKLLREGNGVAALLFVLVVPKFSSECDLSRRRLPLLSASVSQTGISISIASPVNP